MIFFPDEPSQCMIKSFKDKLLMDPAMYILTDLMRISIFSGQLLKMKVFVIAVYFIYKSDNQQIFSISKKRA